MLEPFQLPFVQRGLIAVLILAVPAGILGSWAVLRGLAFFTHAVGTATFPGLVLAGGLGFNPAIGALGAAAAFGATTGGLIRRRALGNDAVTALALAAFLAVGVILASDVFRSGVSTDQLLFGSLFLIGSGEIALAGASAALALMATITLGPRWLAAGFDPGVARSLRSGSAAITGTLLLLLALTTAALLPVAGALLIGALFIVPAATVRLLTARMWSWQVGSVALTAAEGTAGLWLAVKLNAPPGPVIAVLAASLFCAAALWRLSRNKIRSHFARIGALLVPER